MFFQVYGLKCRRSGPVLTVSRSCRPPMYFYYICQLFIVCVRCDWSVRGPYLTARPAEFKAVFVAKILRVLLNCYFKLYIFKLANELTI